MSRRVVMAMMVDAIMVVSRMMHNDLSRVELYYFRFGGQCKKNAL